MASETEIDYCGATLVLGNPSMSYCEVLCKIAANNLSKQLVLDLNDQPSEKLLSFVFTARHLDLAVFLFGLESRDTTPAIRSACSKIIFTTPHAMYSYFKSNSELAFFLDDPDFKLLTQRPSPFSRFIMFDPKTKLLTEI